MSVVIASCRLPYQGIRLTISEVLTLGIEHAFSLRNPSSVKVARIEAESSNTDDKLQRY